eukprot:4577463-Pleurochrysis_carterae.AAC.6
MGSPDSQQERECMSSSQERGQCCTSSDISELAHMLQSAGTADSSRRVRSHAHAAVHSGDGDSDSAVCSYGGESAAAARASVVGGSRLLSLDPVDEPECGGVRGGVHGGGLVAERRRGHLALALDALQALDVLGLAQAQVDALLDVAQPAEALLQVWRLEALERQRQVEPFEAEARLGQLRRVEQHVEAAAELADRLAVLQLELLVGERRHVLEHRIRQLGDVPLQRLELEHVPRLQGKASAEDRAWV